MLFELEDVGSYILVSMLCQIFNISSIKDRTIGIMTVFELGQIN